MKHISVLKKLALFTLVVILIASCREDVPDIANEAIANPEEAPSLVVHDWHEAYLVIERFHPNFRPNPTSRALGYIGLAGYETLIPAMDNRISHRNIYPELTIDGPSPRNTLYWEDVAYDPSFWEAALNACYHEIYPHFFFNMRNQDRNMIDSLFDVFHARYAVSLDQRALEAAEEWGRNVAKSVIRYALMDTEGATQVFETEPLDYTVPVGTGLWRPTFPDFRHACHPYWDRVRMFTTPVGAIQPLPHPPYSEDPNSEFYKQGVEVNETVVNLTNEGRWIAEFWSDDITGLTFSPPARQLALANQLIVQYDNNLREAVELYLRLGFALNDASVVCWGAKYQFNLERPVDYIRRVINPEFRPILGDAVEIEGLNHATFGAVGAGVFRAFYGPTTDFLDRCHENRTEFIGTPRRFTTFDQMAVENAISRIPLGVHFRMDADEGLRLGYQVSDYVNNWDISR